MSERALETRVRALLLAVLWCVVVQGAYAQIATITGVHVVNGTAGVRVEVTGNLAVSPRIVTTHEGRQISLEFTNTVAELPVRLFSINSNGVERVLVTVDRTHAVSTITIVLFRRTQFAYSREGTKIALTIGPRAGESETARSQKSAAPLSGAPAAASGPWISLSRKQKEPALPPSASASAKSATQGWGTGQQIQPNLPAAPASSTTSSSNLNVGSANSVTVNIANSSQPPVVGTQNSNGARGNTTESSRPLSFPAATAAPAGRAATQSGRLNAGVVPAETANTMASVPSSNATVVPSSSAASRAQAVQPKPNEGNPEPTRVASMGASSRKTETAEGVAPTTAPSSTPDQVSSTLPAPSTDLKTAFRVKYVADGAAYLDGGRTAGLAEGVKLVIRDPAPLAAKGAQPGEPVVVAQLKVVSVAETSAVTEIDAPKREVKPGDIAYLTSEAAEALVEQRALSSTRVYPQVITFTQGDPADEEAREEVPRPPLPEVNRARGRIGFEYSSVLNHGSFGGKSSELGLVLRSDITRIGGSYWSLSGYWRGRLESQGSSTQQTMQDLINRTYHLSLTYENPHSRWVMGVGRMFLPWASSLETIDGGYIGRKVSTGVTAGIFAGSTPDPTSWSYNPNQRLAGTFVNFEGGSYDALRYMSTIGFGLSMLQWNIDRPFVFFENGLFYKRFLSIYDSLQMDHPSPTPAVSNPGTGISQSYLTIRVQPIARLALDFNHNYFRDVPTYDLSLVGTGLLDKVLFQGVSMGARLETLKRVWLYTDQGLSNRSGDSKHSINQMYGLSWGDILHSKVTADVHYAKFNSPFAQGSYKALALSRSFTDSLRWEVQVGKQAFTSPLSTDTGSRFLNLSLDSDFGGHYFMMGGVSINRGAIQNYDQWYITLGYRFDNRWKTKAK